MSNKKKPKKLRRPNIQAAGLSTVPAEMRPASTEPAPRAESGRAAFDYTYVRRDLKRIAIVGGGCIAGLLVLALFIR